MEHNYFHQDPISKTETIAKSGPFQIEIPISNSKLAPITS